MFVLVPSKVSKLRMECRLSYRLPSLLADAGFGIIESHRSQVPWGRLCRTIKGGSGADLSEYESFTVKNMRLLFQFLGNSLLSKGRLIYPDGTFVHGEDEISGMLDDIELGMYEEGAVSVGVSYVCQKKGN